MAGSKARQNPRIIHACIYNHNVPPWCLRRNLYSDQGFHQTLTGECDIQKIPDRIIIALPPDHNWRVPSCQVF